MLRALLVLPFAVALLACTGLGTDSGDSATVPEAGVRQTTACKQYLACAETAGKGNLSELEAQYGSEGTCWDSTKAQMQACDDECSGKLDDLEAEYGSGCDGNDTGDTDTGGDTGGDTGVQTDCALLDGYWSFDIEYSADECDLASFGTPWNATTVCHGDGDFDITFDVLGVALPCTSAGTSFDCVLDLGTAFVSANGQSNAKHTTATGQLAVELESCSSAAYLDGVKD